MRRSLAASLLLLCAGCASAPGDLDRHFLNASTDWLAEPAMLGRAAEPFELTASAGTLTGWFLPAKDSGGRTVLLLHDGRVNASQTFPYYSFLLDAGLNVCVYDGCGFGRSKGQAGLRSAFYDLGTLLAWLRARKDVDPARIGWYGIDIGAAVALRAAAFEGGCKALVLEDVPSLRDHLRATVGQGDGVGSSIGVGFAEFVHAPEDSEPSDNAPNVAVPSLWITGGDRRGEEIRSMMRAYVAMGGDKQLWVLPKTARAPHALMTHDGDYQRAVAGFFRSALDGTPDRVTAVATRGAAAETGGNWWDVALDRRAQDQAPWAVQITAVDASGSVTTHNTWLEGAHSKTRMKLAQDPGLVAAMRVTGVERMDLGFKRSGTPLSRAGEWYDAHVVEFDQVRNGDPDLAKAAALADAIRTREQVEPFPAALEAQLADVYYQIGRVMTSQPDAEKRAAGLIWLRRAVHAAPAKPELQYWPGRVATWGFAHQEQVAAAKALLARIEGK